MDECVIGIELNASDVKVVRIRNQKIEKKLKEKVYNKENKEMLINQVTKLIEQLLIPEVEGIGMGVPSVVDTKKGIVYNVQNIPSWEEVHLKSIYQDHFKVPVYVNNDANCFALGEKYFGNTEECKSFVCVTIGSGMGAGLILNGDLFEGIYCGAGEVGMLPYRESIIERYCSEIFFERREGLTSQEVIGLAEADNVEAKALFDELGIHIGRALEAIIYAYAPSLVVLGGSLSKGFKYFRDTMNSSLESFAYQGLLKNLKIKVTDDNYLAAKGAASLSLTE